MDLNWTPEVIAELFVGIIVFFLALLTYISPKTKKIKSLFYIRLSLLFIVTFFLISGISILILDILLHKLAAIFIIPACVCLIIGINYSMKDSYFSLNLIAVLCIGTLFTYFILQPNVIKLAISSGYKTLIWVGLFEIIGNLLLFIYSASVLYWVLKTWINAPVLIKKEAFILVIGIVIANCISLIVYLLDFFFPNLAMWFIVIGDILVILGGIFLIISILREPKLLYILPFTVNRILVKDKKGYPLFDHDWSETNISELMFTGFVNAVQVMSEEMIKRGGLVDIRLKEGILILYDSELITVGLVASKSSKLLRESLVNFSNDFQKMFERELKNSVRSMASYEAAYELIEKHFSNFPYRIITSKNYPLLLSGKFMKIPLELDNKLKKYIADEEDYEFIKSELYKYPPGQTEDFLKLYNEMKEDLDKLPKEDYEHLDLEYNEDT